MNLKAEYIKNLTKEFELIEFFESFKDKPYYFCEDDIQHILYKEDKKFILEFSKEIKVENSKFRFQNIDNKTIDINSLELRILDSNIKTSNFYDYTSFSINSFCSKDFNMQGSFYYRLIIPYHKKMNIRYDDFFSNFDFMIFINNRVFSGIEFKINSFTFQIYHLTNYFIIECIDKINFKQFDNLSRICLAVFGFFTGFAPMEKGYFFQYKKFNGEFNQFLYNSNFIETYYNNSLISLNPYEYYQNHDLKFDFDENGFKNDERIKDIKRKLKPIERKHFKKLIQNMFEYEEFSEIIYTYINISNKNSNIALNIKCASYAILLEMLTNFISKQNEEKLSFIKDKKIQKELSKELKLRAKEIFEKYKIGNFDNSPIKKRIDNINAPTNRDKLFKPFEILGINLSENEKKIIENRNDFLHGKNPVKELKFSEQSQKLFYISLEFNFLVVSLILKFIGYDGVIKNLSKIYLDYLNLPELENEKYYKDLSNDNNN